MDEFALKSIVEDFGLSASYCEQVRAVWLVETDAGLKCLKQVDYDRKRLRFIHAAQEHLARRGFTAGPRFLTSPVGLPFVEYGHDLYVLMDWFSGHECDFHDDGELGAASRLLAGIHGASRGFKPDRRMDPSINWGKLPRKFEEHSRDLLDFRKRVKEKPAMTSFDARFDFVVDHFHTQARRAAEALARSGYREITAAAREEGGFCHGDFHHRNVIIGDDGQAYVIDFDSCTGDIRARDVAEFLIRILNRSSWDPEVAKVILKNYHSRSPLSPQEYAVICARIQFPQKFWRICDRYYEDKRDWPEVRFVEKLNKSIRAFNPREAFVKEFPGLVRSVVAEAEAAALV
ncbi:MAG: CotS family spore coat protein [Actinobacteria bacterium]|nr:CotS family spore coat protein [Actinomycetota bacterium]